MIPLDVIDWAIDLMKKALEVVFAPVMELVMKFVFKPILEAIGSAVGTLMSTIATFWVYVPTISVGNDQGKPANGTVDWVWQHTQFIALFIAAIGLIVGAIQMAWTQRGESARELLRSMITLAVAAAFSIAVAQALITAGDIFSSCIISTALDSKNAGWVDGCQNIASGDSQHFGEVMGAVLGFGAVVAIAGSPLLIGIMIAVGILCVIASLIQIVLMVVRSAMLVLLLGVLPIAAAATNTEMGRTWFKRIISWLLAFILYKPVAAIVYATAIRLVSNNGDPLHFDASNPDDIGSLVMNVVTGLTMLVLALFAMPALMRFIVPMVGATAGGAGAGMIAAKMVGADKVGDMVSKGAEQGSDGGGGGGDGPSGAQNVGRASQQAPSGGGGGGGGGAQGAAAGGEGGAAGAAGGAGGGAAGGAAAGGGGGAAAGGAAAGGGAAAAAGPAAVAVVAVKAGVDATKAVGQMAASETMGNDEMDQGSQGGGGGGGGDGGGPSGSGGGGDLSRERDRAPRDYRDDDRDNYQPPPPDGPSGSS
ncbi:hypothetical protein [Kribbella sp. NPDC003557]|uniref:hypothetical protein n=1 Tax=Kribbella sp. NPDC003557 TaxID=3154449 RepID=UPI00339F0096